MRAHPGYDWRAEQEAALEEEAAEHEAWLREHTRPHRRLARWLDRWVVKWIQAMWGEIAWALFLGALIAFNHPWFVVVIFVGLALGFQHRLFRETRGLRERLRPALLEVERLKRVNRTLAGAVESSAEFIVEQRMEFDGNALGPGVWMGGQWYPVDDEHEEAGA